MPRRNPEDIDLGAIKADLEFLIERGTRFRKEQALKAAHKGIGLTIAAAAQPGLSPRKRSGREWRIRR
jgi:hypothetical protein